MKRTIAPLILAAVMLAPAAAPVAAVDTVVSNQSIENRLATLIDAEYRRFCGRVMPRLRAYQHTNLSRWRAKDMVARNYFSHTVKGTSNNVFDYFRRYGNEDWTMGGENIAWTSYPDRMAADHVFDMFMGSSGHRANIRECSYNAFGVGTYKAGSKRMLVVTFSRQPAERVAIDRLGFRYGPGSSYGIKFVATLGQRQYVFRHRYDSRGNRWDYGRAPAGWGWTKDWETR